MYMHKITCAPAVCNNYWYINDHQIDYLPQMFPFVSYISNISSALQSILLVHIRNVNINMAQTQQNERKDSLTPNLLATNVCSVYLKYYHNILINSVILCTAYQKVNNNKTTTFYYSFALYSNSVNSTFCYMHLQRLQQIQKNIGFSEKKILTNTV